MVMDEDVIADLKQFIVAQMAQQLSELRSELRQDISRVEKKLEKKIDNLSASVAEALDKSNEVIEKQLKNHERRIVRLERKTA
jgi:hypothetical protein